MSGLAQALGAIALMLSFALLGRQRLLPALWLCMLQAFVVALAVLLQRELLAVLCGSVAFALNGATLPLASMRRLSDGPIPRMSQGGWIGAAILAATSIAAAMHVTGGRVEVLGAALSILLLGLLQAVRSPATGLLSAQNGLILLAAVIHLPPLALAAVAIPVVPMIIMAVAP